MERPRRTQESRSHSFPTYPVMVDKPKHDREGRTNQPGRVALDSRRSDPRRPPVMVDELHRRTQPRLPTRPTGLESMLWRGLDTRPSPAMVDAPNRRTQPRILIRATGAESSTYNRREPLFVRTLDSSRNNADTISGKTQDSAPSANIGQSLLRTTYDVQMASKQTLIDSLPPVERQKQEKWAQDQLIHNAGSCVAGFAWDRVKGGYRCQGKHHMVTDELLAEGKGGYYSTADHVNPNWRGPHYACPSAVFIF